MLALIQYLFMAAISALPLLAGWAVIKKGWPDFYARLVGPRADGGLGPALALYALSLAVPALAYQTLGVPIPGCVLLALAPAYAFEGGATQIGLMGWLGSLSNVSFYLGLVLLRSRTPKIRGWARLLGFGALAMGMCTLLPAFALSAYGAEESFYLLPGIALWISAFAYLTYAAGHPKIEAEKAEGSPPVQLTPALVGGSRCAYCHAAALQETRPCPRCNAVLHEDCWLKAESCPTLGCSVRVHRQAA